MKAGNQKLIFTMLKEDRQLKKYNGVFCWTKNLPNFVCGTNILCKHVEILRKGDGYGTKNAYKRDEFKANRERIEDELRSGRLGRRRSTIHRQ